MRTRKFAFEINWPLGEMKIPFTKYQILHTAQWSMGFVGFECFDLQEIMLGMHFNSQLAYSIFPWTTFFYASLPHVTIFCTIMYIVQATRPSKIMWLCYFQVGYVKIFCIRVRLQSTLTRCGIWKCQWYADFSL